MEDKFSNSNIRKLNAAAAKYSLIVFSFCKLRKGQVVSVEAHNLAMRLSAFAMTEDVKNYWFEEFKKAEKINTL